LILELELGCLDHVPTVSVSPTFGPVIHLRLDDDVVLPFGDSRLHSPFGAVTYYENHVRIGTSLKLSLLSEASMAPNEKCFRAWIVDRSERFQVQHQRTASWEVPFEAILCYFPPYFGKHLAVLRYQAYQVREWY
jgi:hypothetical protein